MVREVAVALGGGGSRGLAHIGVLGELERAGYRVGGITGTSIGGVMAAGYAAGYSPAEMAAWAGQALQAGLFRFHPSPGALLGIDRIRDVLGDLLQERTFADVRCPLAVTAVDLDTGEEVLLAEGRILDAVLATIALPGIFPPQWIGSSGRLVDGGILDPVPVRAARTLRDLPVVAVVLSAEPGSPGSGNLGALASLPGAGVLSRLRVAQALEIFSRSLEISSRTFADLRLRIDGPEVVVRPDVADIGILDSPDVGPVVDAGEKAMEAQLEALSRWFGPRGFVNRLGRRVGAGPV